MNIIAIFIVLVIAAVAVILIQFVSIEFLNLRIKLLKSELENQKEFSNLK